MNLDGLQKRKVKYWRNKGIKIRPICGWHKSRTDHKRWINSGDELVSEGIKRRYCVEIRLQKRSKEIFSSFRKCGL